MNVSGTFTLVCLLGIIISITIIIIEFFSKKG